MRYRYTMGLFYFALPVCILLRTLQLIFTVDATTGFIKQQYYGVSVAITVIIFVAVAAVGVLGYTGDCRTNAEKTPKPFVAITSALTGGMFIFNTVSGVANTQYGGWYNVLLVIFGILSAIVFLGYGLKNIYDYNMPSLMLAMPIFYFMIKLITVFVTTSALSLVTENVFMLFTNSALLLFMFEFAKSESGISNDVKENKKLFAYGIASVMLCLISSLPKIITFVMKKISPTDNDISAMILSVSLAIFCFAFTVCTFSDRANKRKRRVVSHLAK